MRKTHVKLPHQTFRASTVDDGLRGGSLVEELVYPNIDGHDSDLNRRRQAIQITNQRDGFSVEIFALPLQSLLVEEEAFSDSSDRYVCRAVSIAMAEPQLTANPRQPRDGTRDHSIRLG
ncbi:uncharacterized protein RHO25_010446 [Cercospora beticola]|uniref:Uncharacterized protein n=1 Tax=Cercospora beticola TaxID=122368 RepID=A0ABZ0P280_CERBT|nr:hypothetical protein RHO25_010446 [Cercospora beticola]